MANLRPDFRSFRRELPDILSVIARWSLGAFFIYMGLNKALHPVEFLKIVRQYQMVSSPFVLNSIGGALPWFEVFCGLLMIAGVAVRGTSLMLIVMLVPFTLAVLNRALGIYHSATALAFCAIKFDCGCGTGEEYICQKLVQNSGLILFSIWLLIGKGRQFSLRYDLLRAKRPETIAAAELSARV